MLKSISVSQRYQRVNLVVNALGQTSAEGATNTLEPRPFFDLHLEIWWHHIISIGVDLINWQCDGV